MTRMSTDLNSRFKCNLKKKSTILHNYCSNNECMLKISEQK